MEKECISGVLDEVEETVIHDGDSYGITFLFESAHKAQFRIKHFEDYAKKITERAANHDRVVVGPQYCQDKFGKYLIFMSSSPDMSSHEGFTFAAHPVENDGWASFQYTVNDLDTVMEFLVDDLPEIGNLLEISKWGSCLSVERPRALTNEAVMNHFEDYEPEFEGIPSPVSIISHEVLLAFYSKGWNLYKDTGKMASEIIKHGPATQLWINDAYHLFPIAFPSKDVDAVQAEIISMKGSNQYPSWIDSDGRNPVSVVTFEPNDVKFVIRDRNNLAFSVPYWDLDKVLDEGLSTYDSQK